ncbi:MAG: hypothetical protein ABW049_09710 [Spongiibacteraceae bacterium]
MNAFRIFLAIAWVIVTIVTVRAFQLLGPDAGSVFFGDFAIRGGRNFSPTFRSICCW